MYFSSTYKFNFSVCITFMIHAFTPIVSVLKRLNSLLFAGSFYLLLYFFSSDKSIVVMFF